MRESLPFFFSGGLLMLAAALKIPALLRDWHDQLLRSVVALLLIGSPILICAAPLTIVAVNRATGITNFAAPMVYVMLTAFSGASIVLLINWRGGPAARIRRASRRCVAAYSGVVVSLIALFWVGEAPVEQLTEFDTYYATTPFIREMIVLYLLAHSVATVAATVFCWGWSREVRGTLRAGLRVLVAGYLLQVGYDAAKAAAVAARWAGTDWDHLSTDAAPAFSYPSALLSAVGFLLPLVGRRLSRTGEALCRLRRLAPLSRELDRFATEGAVRVRLAWWSPRLRLRLTQRETHIADGILACAPYFDDAVWHRAHAAALADGADEAAAAVIAEAAMLVAAIDAKAAPGARPGDPAADTGPLARARRSDDLVPLALALASPTVQAVRRGRPVPAGEGAP
ncbi:MAB_1171c family putative transporter [Streptomyces sp. TRM70308]|uniref:MAB_1171c family putative transporter n=1 Tax=Streptomyces sp. TRM70308 TaxID=3131932 RepID=UPI003D0367E8